MPGGAPNKRLQLTPGSGGRWPRTTSVAPGAGEAWRWAADKRGGVTVDVLLVVDMQEGLLSGGPKHDLLAVVERINRLALRVR